MYLIFFINVLFNDFFKSFFNCLKNLVFEIQISLNQFIQYERLTKIFFENALNK